VTVYCSRATIAPAVMKNAALSNLNFPAPFGVAELDGADAEVDPTPPDADVIADARVEVTTEEVANKDVVSVPTSTVK